MRYDQRLRPTGRTKWLLLFWGLAILVGGGLSARLVLAASASTWDRVVGAASGLFLLATATLIITAAIRVQVSETTLTASFWPLMRRRISLRDIHSATSVRIDPRRDYGGWGIKGKKDNLLMGLSGNEGVQIDYGQEKRLVILTEDPAPLLRAIGKTPAHRN